VAHIITIGNEKGGSGKSTVSMHVSVALARMGWRVGAMDLDLRQLSFGHYLDNRTAFIARSGHALPLPRYAPLPDAAQGTPPDDHFAAALEPLHAACDFVVIDCPGAHTRYSQVAHAVADTLITPINDSFIDFDLLARIDPDSGKVLAPSIYSQMVWTARQNRAAGGLRALDWLVLRNRLGSTAMRNKRRLGDALGQLSSRIGFRLAPGFGERVIFRELFPNGLTLLDMRDVGTESLSLSHVAARQELRELMRALDLPGVQVSV